MAGQLRASFDRRQADVLRLCPLGQSTPKARSGGGMVLRGENVVCRCAVRLRFGPMTRASRP
jgi:alpha-D-ribose 1-methylphosphonate 5-triphosphate synthase subunit PhnG